MPTTQINSGIDGLVRQDSGTSYAQAVGGSGNFNSSTTNNVANVNTGTTFFCGRSYYRFDTTSIATNQVATAAFLIVQLESAQGGTTDNTEKHKIFNSTDHSSTFGSALFDTIGNAMGNAVDVGNTANEFLSFEFDSTGLAYINTQIAAGNQCAFLQRCQNDYQNPNTDPSAVSFRVFTDFEDATSGDRPLLRIVHDTPSANTDKGMLTIHSNTIIVSSGLIKF